MKVSVLIGSRNRGEVLKRCLESVCAQRYNSLEILVLDDNSTYYQLQEIVTTQFQDSRLRYFRSDESLGVAGGRNFLGQQASGDIFCVIDDDAYFTDYLCISRMVETFASQPAVGILAFKVINFYQTKQPNLFVPFSQRWLKKQPDLTIKPRLVSYYLGACHALRRQVIDQCGGYQPGLIFGEEEQDLSYRALEAGFEIMYRPEVVVHHHPQSSVVEQLARHRQSELYHHVRNRFYLAYTYLPWVYIPTYLTIWLSVYARDALQGRALREFLAGVVAGVKMLPKLKRTPLSQQTVHYLQTHYGRLWY
jgi:GT2 family glycosyltransferase